MEHGQVFDKENVGRISYALEKVGAFISVTSPVWQKIRASDANVGTKEICDILLAFEAKLRAMNVSEGEIEHEVGTAIYAVMELQSLISGDKSEVTSPLSALIYREFLYARIEQLREKERSLDGSSIEDLGNLPMEALLQSITNDNPSAASHDWLRESAPHGFTASAEFDPPPSKSLVRIVLQPRVRVVFSGELPPTQPPKGSP